MPINKALGSNGNFKLKFPILHHGALMASVMANLILVLAVMNKQGH